jgi:pimeloyl-ACP methyl ester carboxylesterase
MTGEPEFSSVAAAAAEIGRGAPLPGVARLSAADGRVSVVRWGRGDPAIVFLHGGGQNARTWDLVALAVDRPALAVDLLGHERSDWRTDREYRPERNADAIAAVLRELAPRPVVLVGMSLGGLTAIRLASVRPEHVRALVVVDVTPGVSARTRALTVPQRGATALIGGPARFDSLDEMVELAVQASPRRSLAAVRRGVVHNARQLPDGGWAWRYDRLGGPGDPPLDFAPLWDDVAALRVPTLLVRGGESAFVGDEDEQEFRRLHPGTRSAVVAGAGHSVQSDRPRELAELIVQFAI